MDFRKTAILLLFSFSVLVKQVPGYEDVGNNIKYNAIAIMQNNEFENLETVELGNANSEQLQTPILNDNQTILVSPTPTITPIVTQTTAPTIMLTPVTTKIVDTSNLLVYGGNTIDEGDDLANWTKDYNAYLLIDKDNYVSGSESLKIVSRSASKGYFSVEKNIVNLFEDGNMENFELNMYIPDTEMISSIGIAFFNDDKNYTKYFSNFIGNYELTNGWNKIRRSRSSFESSISKNDWNKVKCMRLTFYTTGNENVIVNIDRIAYNVKGVPKLMFTFEDGYWETLANAYPVLNSKGFKANVMAIKSRAELANKDFLDIKNLDFLYKNGWDIGNHTETHPQSTEGYTFQTKTSEYLNCQNWLLQYGWIRGAHHISYPSGFYDSEIANIAKSIGAKTAKGDDYGIQSIPVEDIYNLKSIKIGKDISVDFVKAEIEKSINTGSTVIITVHKVVETPVLGFDVSFEYFEELVDFVYKKTASGTVDVVTISKWYDSYLD